MWICMTSPRSNGCSRDRADRLWRGSIGVRIHVSAAGGHGVGEAARRSILVEHDGSLVHRHGSWCGLCGL